MRANRRRDTLPELRIRSLLHARGLRYRVDRPIRIDGARSIRPDIVFAGARIAVFVDGCYWHGCPEHHQPSRSNVSYWEAKIGGNRERDRRQDRLLAAAGWTVLRVWEHEDPVDAVGRIVTALGPGA
jgi:DNA mismatch endonuclease (patch repair protein)